MYFGFLGIWGIFMRCRGNCPSACIRKRGSHMMTHTGACSHVCFHTCVFSHVCVHTRVFTRVCACACVKECHFRYFTLGARSLSCIFLCAARTAWLPTSSSLSGSPYFRWRRKSGWTAVSGTRARVMTSSTGRSK